MSSFIEIRHLSKVFSSSQVAALKDISAAFSQGQFVGLVGPDGAGKTTLLRLMAGLLLPTKGSILIDNLDVVKDAEKIHEISGYMPQKFGLYEDLTVQQNLDLYADLRGLMKKEKGAVFAELLSFTHLAPFRERLAGDLSGGMKQKLGLACVLIKKPSLLLLDEPSVGIDPLSRRELWNMLQGLVEKGLSVVWSTSYLDEAEKCSSLLLLNEGKLLYQGPPKELMRKTASSSFEEAFFQLIAPQEKVVSILAQTAPQVQNVSDVPIEAKNLTKAFGNFVAVNNMTFSVRPGEIFGLLGPNGAGKSTTFKMLCGLLKPTSGSARVDGLDFQKVPGIARSQIGYMAQKFSLYDNLTVRHNLAFFAGIYNLQGKHKAEKIAQCVEIFHLEPYLSLPADSLPLGFKQRLALACATMHHPKALFLDEPTSGVDPVTRREFWSHIKGLVKKGVTIMISTHFMAEAEQCDRLGLIYQGELIHIDTPMALKSKAKAATLEDAFITLVQKKVHDD